MPKSASLVTTHSSTAAPRAGLSRFFKRPGLEERAGQVLFPDELTGLDTWELCRASLPWPFWSRVFLFIPVRAELVRHVMSVLQHGVDLKHGQQCSVSMYFIHLKFLCSPPRSTLTFFTLGFLSGFVSCRQIHLTRHFSHAHVITCISHCMAQDEPPNVSVCALHSIFMPSMMCV